MFDGHCSTIVLRQSYKFFLQDTVSKEGSVYFAAEMPAATGLA